LIEQSQMSYCLHERFFRFGPTLIQNGSNGGIEIIFKDDAVTKFLLFKRKK
jgi:hypothetical protein